MLICPKCGVKSTERDFIEAFCGQCYPLHLRFPRQVEYEHCKDCGNVRMAGHWVPADPALLQEKVLRQCKGEYEKVEYNIDRQEAVFTLRSGARVVRPILLKQQIVICPTCSRRRGGYYEAVLQLRGLPEKVERHAQQAKRWLEKTSWVAKIEKTSDGVDVYAGSYRAAMGFIQKYGLPHLHTRKLVGQRKGKRIYRSTFAIRLD